MPKGWKSVNASHTNNVYVYGLHTYLSLYNKYINYIGSIAVLTTFWHLESFHSTMSIHLYIYLSISIYKSIYLSISIR